MSKKNSLIKNETQDLGGDLDVTPPQRLPGYGYGYGFDLEAETHLRDHWRAVRERLWLVIGLTTLITLSVLVYLARKPDFYEAEAQVQVNLENPNSPSGYKGGPFIVNPVNDPAYFNTQLQLLVRPWLLRRVVKTLDLEHNEAFLTQSNKTRSLRQKLTRSLGFGKQDTADGQNDPTLDGPQGGEEQSSASPEDIAEATQLAPYVAALREGLTVEPVKEARLPIKETRLINISFTHPDPVLAARVLNTIADTFVLSNLEKKTSANTATGDILQKRIAELKSQVLNGEEQLMRHARDHQILSLTPGQNTVVERLTGLNRQLLEAENERKLTESAYQAALAPGAALALAEDSGKLASEAENKLAELRQRRAQLLVEATEDWPEVKEVERQIAALEKHIQETRDRAATVAVTNLNTRYRQALAREQSLQVAFDKQSQAMITQNEAAIHYRIIQQEIETTKTLLDGLLQRRKENDGMLAGLANNIAVNDYAVVPQQPIGPRRWLYTGVAFVLSLGLSVGLALLLDYMDNTVRSTEDVEKILRLRTLAVVPSVNGTGLRHRLLSTDNGARADGTGRDALLLDLKRPSVLTEIYRHLRTSLLLSGDGKAIKSVLVTSSLPSEGKTTTAINMAVILAQTGANVLLIDADARRPHIHTILDLSNQRGLSTILSDQTEESEALTMIEHHVPSGISVLTSGPALPNFTELLGSEKMRRLMETFCSNFNYVIIDSSPVAYFADSLLISQAVDGVLMVIKSGKSPFETVRRSCQLFQDFGPSLLGVVLNEVKGFPYNYDYYDHQSKKPADMPPERKAHDSRRLLT